jgi:hypothetical protein
MTQITQAEKKRRNTLKRGGKNTVGFAEVKKLEAAEAIRVHRAPFLRKKSPFAIRLSTRSATEFKRYCQAVQGTRKRPTSRLRRTSASKCAWGFSIAVAEMEDFVIQSPLKIRGWPQGHPMTQ